MRSSPEKDPILPETTSLFYSLPSFILYFCIFERCTCICNCIWPHMIRWWTESPSLFSSSSSLGSWPPTWARHPSTFPLSQVQNINSQVYFQTLPKYFAGLDFSLGMLCNFHPPSNFWYLSRWVRKVYENRCMSYWRSNWLKYTI